MGAHLVYEILSCLCMRCRCAPLGRPSSRSGYPLNLRRFPGVCYHVYGPSGDYLEGLFIYHYVILSIFVIRNQITLTTVFGSKVKKLTQPV